jgi:hypothetical protein
MVGKFTRRFIKTTQLVLNKTIAGAAAVSNGIAKMTMVDVTTISSGTNKGLYLHYTHQTNAITSQGEINVLAIDFYATSALIYAYAVSIYMSQTGDVVGRNAVGIWIYMEDMGTATDAVFDLFLDRVVINRAEDRDGFIRCKNHGTADAKCVFHIEGSGSVMAQQLFIMNTPGSMLAGALSGSIVASLKVKIGALGSETQYYIPLYQS